MEYPKRKSARLKDYDYSQNGCYFVTICTHNRQCLFGEIVGADDSVRPNIKLTQIGKIIDHCLSNIDNMYDNVKIDKYVIMPDHIHSIIRIDDTGGQSRPPLPKIVQGFKSITTRMCFKFGYSKIWQRSYYDHIIRDENDYLEVWKYIDDNPFK